MASILLIYPKPENPQKKHRFGFSLTLLYMAAILKESGHQIHFKDFSVEPFDKKDFSNLLSSVEVVIMEYDSFPLKRTINIEHGEELAHFIKRQNNSLKTIAFGYDCVLFPGKRANIDFTYSVEPEWSIQECVNNLLNHREFKVTSPVNINAHGLDDLPFPDRDILPDYLEHGGTLNRAPHLAKSTLVQTSRGCLNSCRFCQRQGWNNEFRTHSINYVVNEFSMLREKNYRNIWVTDENFSFDLKRAKKLLSRLAQLKITENMKIAISSWSWVDFEFLELAKKASVSIISFGVESVSQEILRFYQKQIDHNSLNKLICYADEIGLFTTGNFIIGAPMETEENIQDTFSYALKLPFDQVNIKILDYMAGSQIYTELPAELSNQKRHLFACKENGLNSFPLEHLRQKINNFYDQFNRSVKNRLYAKIKKNGTPYFSAPYSFRRK